VRIYIRSVIPFPIARSAIMGLNRSVGQAGLSSSLTFTDLNKYDVALDREGLGLFCLLRPPAPARMHQVTGPVC
jgi:hypothetical protein